MKSYRLAVALAVASVLSGCNGILGLGGEERRIGTISFHHDPVVIVVPDRVRRNEPFEVRVRTYGGGCVRQGSTGARVDGLRAEVTPYDIHSGASVCTDILRLFTHGATLTFDRAGSAVVVVRGRREPEDRILTVEQPVVVE